MPDPVRSPEQWMVDMFMDNVLHELQQGESVLEPCVNSGTMSGRKKRYKYLGLVEMVEKLGRKSDTQWQEFDQFNRWCFGRTFNYPWLEDIDELEKQMQDPRSDYVLAVVKAARRRKDRSIIEAFNAPSFSGEDENIVQHVFPDRQVLDIQLGGAGANTGMNLAKLKRISFLFKYSDIPADSELFISATAKQVEEMMNIEEMTNIDYAAAKALVTGKVDTFLGLKFVGSQLFPFDEAAEIRTNFAWAKDCMQTAISRELSIKSAPVPTKNFEIGTYAEMRLGAVRLFDKGVIEIPCKEVPETE